MKKIFLIGVGFLIAVGIFGFAGFAYAQINEPPDGEKPYGVELFPGGGRMFGGSQSGMTDIEMHERKTGPLHDYLWPATAEAFGLTDVQIKAFEVVRETKEGLRDDLSAEEFRDRMKQAMTSAVENALADEAISAEEAEQYLDNLEKMERFPAGRQSGRRGQQGDFRRGFSKGVKFGRQILIHHEYLDVGLAEGLGITVDELQDMRSEGGFSWQAYAEEELNLSDAEIKELRFVIISTAIEAALDDDAITQEMADRYLELLENLNSHGEMFSQP